MGNQRLHMGGSVGWAGSGGGGPQGRPPTAIHTLHYLHTRNDTRNIRSVQGMQGSTNTGHTLTLPSDMETSGSFLHLDAMSTYLLPVVASANTPNPLRIG